MYWQVQECRRSRCAKGYAAPAAILGLCPDCNTYPLLKLTAIFPPTECLTAPASYCPRAVRRGDEHRTWTSVPLRDALFGGLGLVSTSGPITPQHGTRDRRNSRWP